MYKYYGKKNKVWIISCDFEVNALSFSLYKELRQVEVKHQLDVNL